MLFFHHFVRQHHFISLCIYFSKHFHRWLETIYPSVGNLTVASSENTWVSPCKHLILDLINQLCLRCCPALPRPPSICRLFTALRAHRPWQSTETGMNLARASQNAWGVSSKELAAIHAKEMAFTSWIRMFWYIKSAIPFSLRPPSRGMKLLVSFWSSNRIGSNFTS